ncbi:hypothetical protein [Bradyrhizobium cenepequi]|uniref:hypothetical protein n=1 Tax=Bradyrhizobium cenepequi TaxID=2821403 RepID=UPI001CE312CC|nr:hypothetical protein [Bradyrhizobium cenepequi]MCA6108171.1 hypothetical protein [Bradyrhizobium cenepequi]
MDAKLKSEWVADLRSGKFTQNIGRLYDPKTGGYCCLGVLARRIGHRITNNGYSADGYRQFHEVVGSAKACTDLWHMNDKGVPFDLIADHIEATL